MTEKNNRNLMGFVPAFRTDLVTAARDCHRNLK